MSYESNARLSSANKPVSGNIMRPESRGTTAQDTNGSDEVPSAHRHLDGVEVEHRAPRCPNPLHGGRRVVSRIGLDGHELLLELDRLADFPSHSATVVGLFADECTESDWSRLCARRGPV